LSERDITRAVGEHGGKIDAMQIEELMVKDVITCPYTCIIAEAMQIMQSNGIRHLPVLAGDDRVIGMISMRDMMEICVGDMMGMGLKPSGNSSLIIDGGPFFGAGRHFRILSPTAP